MILNNILKNSSQKFNSKTALTMQMGFRIKNLSYLEVYNLAKQVSVFLGNNNINYQDKVLLCAPNSPYWIIVFWGCLLRGAILVPLNIQSTSDVINAIIKETKSKILFKNGSFKQNILDKNIKSFNTEFLLEYLENTNINNYKETKITPEDLVQIMYTSGTTGSPKGVMLSHKNILSNVQSVNKAISMSSRQDKLLSILPLSHIYEQTIGFLLPYSMGVQIIYAHSHLEIRNLLKKYKITRMLAVPEFLQLFISRIELGFTEKNKLKLFNKLLKFSKKLNSKFLSRILFYFILKKFGGKLHTIASGGAALDPALEEKWEALGVTILQGYGLTETSPVISTNTYKDHKLGSVGKPISEVKVKLSKNKEILVSGPNVFSGYYQNLEKTREVLSSDGWFNTEDLGEIDKDGFLFIKGRKKYLILGPGGQNVYPEDIEFQLNKSSKVLESCVVGIDHTNSATQIQAAVIPAKDIKLTDKDLEDILSNTNNKLVSYQHLNKIVVWPEPEFPKTATRKVKKPLITEFLTNIKNNVHNQDLNKKNNTNSRPEFEKLAKIWVHLKIYYTFSIISCKY